MPEPDVPGAPGAPDAPAAPPPALGDVAARLATRAELAKLAHELDLAPEELAFLADEPADALRALRTDVATSLAGRHAARLRRVASLAGALPPGLAARAAQQAGPVVGARVASALDAEEAVRLAGRLPLDFLAELTLSLDTAGVERVVPGLDPALVTAVGRRLLEDGEHLVLGRLVSAVPPQAALAVVAHADPAALLQVALLVDDRSVLPGLVRELPAEQLRAVLAACHDHGTETDALTLLTALDAPGRGRVLVALASLPAEHRAGFLAVADGLGAWSEVLPGLAHVDDASLRTLLGSPAGPAARAGVGAAARAAGDEATVARLDAVGP
ncbi:hypothetical protein ACOACO_12480 [Nocardioides sp. CPCC 205120]|uniref:hypothetical protein n=1 Tax=Nocardioides sp. CPCC 205120 TaxID=3406462 RepID=UPI003B506F29